MVDEPILDDCCVLFALAREAEPFYKEFRPRQEFAGAPCRARFCGPEWLTLLVLEGGIGPAAEAALSWALARPNFGNVPYRPRLVLSAGFAGALREGQAVGDVVLATEVVDETGECWPTTWPTALPEGMWRPPLRRGRLFCSPYLVGDPDEKRRLGTEHDALAVDMESAAIARLCRKHEIPFGCVKAISDGVHTSLSAELVTLLSRGRVSPLSVVAALARRPVILGDLWQLARDTRRAAEQLKAALGELLTLTVPWGRDLNRAS